MMCTGSYNIIRRLEREAIVPWKSICSKPDSLLRHEAEKEKTHVCHGRKELENTAHSLTEPRRKTISNNATQKEDSNPHLGSTTVTNSTTHSFSIPTTEAHTHMHSVHQRCSIERCAHLGAPTPLVPHSY
jgi:hypothetical protein